MSERVRLRLTKHHPGQARVVAEAKRFNTLACGRRFGKTTLGIERLVHPALKSLPVAWFSPTYKMLAEIWREARLTLDPITERINAQEKRIELITGGVMDMWSLDAPDGPRGRKYARIVIDEAAMIPALKEAWQQVIRPTLTDYEGDAWFLSTPKGINFFKELFDKGQDPLETSYASWQMPTLTNPFIKPSEVDAARAELPAQVFQQEYLAEFLQNEGAVFRNIQANLTAPADARAEDHKEHRIVAGVDWGQKNDFTVICAFCVNCKTEVELDRFNKIEWAHQRGRLRTVYDRWQIKETVAEENSIGSPNIEALRREGMRVTAFQTTPASKPPLIQSLALALERTEAKWLNDPVAKAEMVAYESKVNTHTGRVSYSAPEGLHDDTVIARALALYAACGRQTVEFY